MSMSFIQQLLQLGVYKRNQGRVARQVTCAAIWVAIAALAWRLNALWLGEPEWKQFGVPVLVLVIGCWLGYRLVNVSSFADFLIAVEGEMAKVSWPSRPELIRSSIVVIVTIFLMAAVLYVYDNLWIYLLRSVGVGVGA